MTTRVWTVGELTRRIKDILETEIDQVWVQGEISGCKIHPTSGHAYFSLKDERAVISCVIWASTLRRLAVAPRNGLRSRIFGRISVYEPRGVYQIYVDRIVPEGEGALQAAFLELKRKLEAEGLFDRARKRPLPTYPRSIGVVTSPSGAAFRDILRILRRRWPLLEVVLAPAAVQGAEAAVSVADAIDRLNRRGGLDLLIIGRGGGSLEDLWAFNEEPVARAIARSVVPVISAVGHEIDFTISDFVADARAATPTHAAEMATPDRRELGARLLRDHRSLRNSLDRKLEGARLRLDRARRSRGFARPEELVRRGQLDADRLADRLRAALGEPARIGRERAAELARRLLRAGPETRVVAARSRVESVRLRYRQSWTGRRDHLRHRLEMAGAALRALGPRQVLARGYSIARRWSDGAVLRAADAVSVGERIGLWLHEGRLRCVVEGRGETGEREPNL